MHLSGFLQQRRITKRPLNVWHFEFSGLLCVMYILEHDLILKLEKKKINASVMMLNKVYSSSNPPWKLLLS